MFNILETVTIKEAQMKMLLNQDLENILTKTNAICRLFFTIRKKKSPIRVGECLQYSIQNCHSANICEKPTFSTHNLSK